MVEAGEQEMRRRQVPAVTRAISILRQLGKADAPVGVNQIARELELVPSTCLHILRVLVDEGLVSFDPSTKRYAIDVGILPIARNALQRNSFSNVVEPQLTTFSLEFNVTGIATQLSDPNYMVVVAISKAPLPFRLQVDLGSRFPALVSATGRCFAAFEEMPEAELRKGFRKVKWDQPPSFEQWLSEVEETRKRGYAIDHGAYIQGVTIVAVPFFGQSGRMTQSLVAIGISEKVEATGAATIAEGLVKIRDYAASLLINGAPAVAAAPRARKAQGRG